LRKINTEGLFNIKNEIGEYRNFEFLYFSFLNEEHLLLKDDKVYQKRKNEPYRIFENKLCNLLLKLNNCYNIQSSFQFKLWDFETFYNFYKKNKIPEMEELMLLSDNTFHMDEIISIGRGRCRSLFSEYYHFEVNQEFLCLKNIINEKSLKILTKGYKFINNHEDSNFLLFKNGIIFEKTQRIYLFIGKYIVLKDFFNYSMEVFENGVSLGLEDQNKILKKL
jgi:hypothetical protein